jgi:hypothetical protein
MIRPFDLRDVQLVRRLDDQGVVFDSRSALIDTHHPLRDALLAYLFPGHGAATYVLRLKQPGADLRAFGQIRVSSSHPQARLTALAVSPAGHESAVWPQMLDILTAQAGRHGAQNVMAQIADDDPGFELLRRSDFLVYSRQEIWRLDAAVPATGEMHLRTERSGDQWHIQQLAGNTVPRLVQQIEPLEPTGHGMVWMEGETLMAYVCARRGQRGTWLQLYLHPEVDRDAHLVMQQAVAHYEPSPEVPLYCCVRRYQDWLTRSLEELDFTPVGSQAVMVRHTVARVTRPELTSIHVHETGLEATSPLVHGSALSEPGRK